MGRNLFCYLENLKVDGEVYITFWKMKIMECRYVGMEISTE